MKLSMKRMINRAHEQDTMQVTGDVVHQWRTMPLARSYICNSTRIRLPDGSPLASMWAMECRVVLFWWEGEKALFVGFFVLFLRFFSFMASSALLLLLLLFTQRCQHCDCCCCCYYRFHCCCAHAHASFLPTYTFRITTSFVSAMLMTS